MWQSYINAADLKTVLDVLSEKGEKARIVAGATDLILEIEHGVRKGIETLIDITRVAGLDQIELNDSGDLHMGPMVTHNHCIASELIRERAFPLALAAWNVGSPQIRNRGTIAGNLVTASPANDTISPLMALNARLKLKSLKGERTVPVGEFYLGVRQTVMQPDEMLVDIIIPSMRENQRGIFMKHALRRAQAISVINVTALLTFSNDIVSDAAITLGAVAPTIIHAEEAEKFLVGMELTAETKEVAAKLAMEASKPISDLRSSKDYRKEIVRVLTRRSLEAIEEKREKEGLPDKPALLWGKSHDKIKGLEKSNYIDLDKPIKTSINGKGYVFNRGQGKTLLRLIREETLLTGTKEGCAEGECGACTVYLDGMAVMSCMIPAPRADGAEIVTIEGLAVGEKLHPLQQTFIEEGAVQCGYCTPGFIMAAAKLLEENPSPDTDQVKQSITGNLCRCTGYYKIIKAIEKAATLKV